MRNFFMAALLVLFSINGVASAAEEDDIFEIEAEGSCQMVAGVSIELVKKNGLIHRKKTGSGFGGKIPFRSKPYWNRRIETG